MAHLACFRFQNSVNSLRVIFSQKQRTHTTQRPKEVGVMQYVKNRSHEVNVPFQVIPSKAWTDKLKRRNEKLHQVEPNLHNLGRKWFMTLFLCMIYSRGPQPDEDREECRAERVGVVPAHGHVPPRQYSHNAGWNQPA